MRDARNIGEVDDLCPQWMGFIFWPKSSRFVSQKPDCMPAYAQRVGVFVDENVERVKQTAADFSLGIIQLHGKEPPEYADGLRKWKVVKAFNIAAADVVADTYTYRSSGNKAQVAEPVIAKAPQTEPVSAVKEAPVAAKEPVSTPVEKATKAQSRRPAAPKTHKVKKGETLYSIARQHNTTVAEICRRNHIKESSTLKLGQNLTVK